MNRYKLYTYLIGHLIERGVMPKEIQHYTFLSIAGGKLYIATSYWLMDCYLITNVDERVPRILEWGRDVGYNTVATTNEEFIRINECTTIEKGLQAFYSIYTCRMGRLDWHGMPDIGYYVFTNDSKLLLPLFFNLETKEPIKAERID